MFRKIIQKLLSPKPSSMNLKELVEEGALILDVRTPEEFAEGHISGSQNISLQTLPQRLNELNPEQTIITCCAAGIRSENAKQILQHHGFTAHNGGGWQWLQDQLK